VEIVKAGWGRIELKASSFDISVSKSLKVEHETSEVKTEWHCGDLIDDSDRARTLGVLAYTSFDGLPTLAQRANPGLSGGF
jgi:hypothetical protein